LPQKGIEKDTTQIWFRKFRF